MLYSIQHFVAYNDFGIEHVMRNILLSQKNIRTWYYMHSCHSGDLFVPEGKKDQYRHVTFSYLFYDNLVRWNRNIEGFFKPHSIGQFLDLGCLWSEHIHAITSCRDFDDLKGQYRSRAQIKADKIIAVFDTTFGAEKVILGSGDMALFLRDILRLLEDFADVQVIFKEKNDFSNIIEQSSDVKSYYAKLRNHKRCFFPGDTADTAEINAMADLALSICFTSSTIEALGARKKAIFFDPAGRFKGTHYDKIPQLVAHDYSELKSLVQYWLYDASDDEFYRWVDAHIVGEIDAFADGKAITRMRKLLSKRNGEK